MFYYDNEGWVSTSKLEAIIKNNSSGNVKFYYYDDAFSSINWNTPVTNTLEECYKQQALRIRDLYDRVILCYSGGYDSTKVLEVFVNNNINLDKIVTIGSFSQDVSTKTDINNNLECYINAYPLIQKFNLGHIYEVIDYVKEFSYFDKFNIYEHGEKWVDAVGLITTPYHIFWKHIEEHIVPFSWRDKKTAIIFGKERPSINIDEKGIYTFFNDYAYMCHGNSTGTSYADRINFFSDPQFPIIKSKQCQELVSLIKFNIQDNRLNITSALKKAVREINTIDRNNLLYSIDNLPTYKSAKNVGWLSRRDTFIIKNKDTKIHDFFKMGVKHIIKTLNNSNTFPELYTFKSKKYYLE